MRLIALVFFLSLSSLLASQNNTIDSLLFKLKTSTDSIQSDILNALSNEFSETDPAKAITYANNSIELSEKIKYLKGIAYGKKQKAFTLLSIGEFNKARVLYIEILDYFKNSPSELGKIYNNLGRIENNLGNFTSGVNYLLNALQCFDKIKDIKSKVVVYLNLGGNYGTRGDFENGLKFNSLALTEALNADGYKLCTIYEAIGTDLIYLNRAKEGLENYRLAAKCHSDNKDTHGLANLYTNISNYYNEINDNVLSIEYAYKALHLFTEGASIPSDIIPCYMNLAASFFNEAEKNQGVKTNQLRDSCLHYLNLSVVIAKQHNLKGFEMSLSKRKAEYFSRIKQYEGAFNNLTDYMNIHDSILSIEKENKISELNIKYEVEKRETENKMLAQQNQIQSLQLSKNKYFIGGLVILSFLILLFALLFLRQNKLRASQKSIQLEQKLLRSQMNPHFIFNSLIAIESYIYDNDPSTAGAYLSKFAQLMYS